MIYLVLESDYEITTILGIFDKKDLAEEVAEINKSYYIREYEINKLTEDGKQDILMYIKELKEDLGIKE